MQHRKHKKPDPSGWLRDQTDQMCTDEQAHDNIIYNQTVRCHFNSSHQIAQEQLLFYARIRAAAETKKKLKDLQVRARILLVFFKDLNYRLEVVKLNLSPQFFKT